MTAVFRPPPPRTVADSATQAHVALAGGSQPVGIDTTAKKPADDAPPAAPTHRWPPPGVKARAPRVQSGARSQAAARGNRRPSRSRPTAPLPQPLPTGRSRRAWRRCPTRPTRSPITPSSRPHNHPRHGRTMWPSGRLRQGGRPGPASLLATQPGRRPQVSENGAVERANARRRRRIGAAGNDPRSFGPVPGTPSATRWRSSPPATSWN